MQRVERLWPRRLRWRLRGAWQWPAFAALTVVDGVVLAELPFTGDGPGLYGGILLAGFANLAALAALAPAGGRLLRGVRPDLPRLIASDYAGAWLLVLITAALLTAGLAHRPTVVEAERDREAMAAAVHDYVLRSAPEHRGALDALDARRLEPDYYRACVPAAEPGRAFCLFVNTAQRPPGVTRDTNETPNSEIPPGR
jgi:hypothetical protein